MMISPTGQKVSVGDNLINKFLSRGFTLTEDRNNSADQSDFVELASRKGNIVRVKKDQVGKYIDKGFTKPNEENWGRLIYNGVEQGLLNVVDLPQNLVALAELGAKGVQYVLEGLDLPTNTDWTLQTKPLSKSIKETVKEKLGYEPAAYSPRTTMGKIASGTITGATELPLGGYWGNFAKGANKLTNATKLTSSVTGKLGTPGNVISSIGKGIGKTGKFLVGEGPKSLKQGLAQAAIGSTIGGSIPLLESSGVDPDTAGLIGGLAIPAALGLGAGVGNAYFSTKSAQREISKQILDAAVSSTGKDAATAKLELINTLEAHPNAIPAEVLDPVTIANLSKRAGVTTDELLRQNHLKNQELQREMSMIGDTGLSQSDLGNRIRTPIAETYSKARNKRASETLPYHEKLQQQTDLYGPQEAAEYLAKVRETEAPDTKSYFEKYANEVWVKDNKGQAVKQMLPIQIENILQELTDKINVAYAGGENKLARKLKELKDRFTETLEKNPQGIIHRKLHKDLSKEVNMYEESDLLNKFVAKDKGKHVVGDEYLP